MASASSRTNDEDRIIDLCIGLEAILGSGFGETAHRICMRAAAMLTMIGWYSSAVNYRAIREVYEYRSRVVHGDPGPYKRQLIEVDGDPLHASRVATAALSSLLRSIISNENFDPEKIEETFIFAAFDATAELMRGASTE